MSMSASEHKKMSIEMIYDKESKAVVIEMSCICEYEDVDIAVKYHVDNEQYNEAFKVKVFELREVLDRLTKFVEELEETLESSED